MNGLTQQLGPQLLCPSCCPSVLSAFPSLLPFSLFAILTFPNVTVPTPGTSDRATAGVRPYSGCFFKKGGKTGPGLPALVLAGVLLGLNM